MKPPTWIKTFGILCIVLGGLGLLRSLLFLPYTMQSDFFSGSVLGIPQSTVRGVKALVYFGFFVSTFYLTAGIVYLKKKRYAQGLIIAALVLSMLYSLLPKFLLDAEIFKHIAHGRGFSYLNAGVDLVLLTGVLLLHLDYQVTEKETIRQVLSRRHLRIPAAILMGILLFWALMALLPAELMGGFFFFAAYGTGFLLAGLALGAIWPENGWKTGLWLGGTASLLFYTLNMLSAWFAGGWDFTLSRMNHRLLSDLGFYGMILAVACLGSFLGSRWKRRAIPA